jgi:hypothetical protein
MFTNFLKRRELTNPFGNILELVFQRELKEFAAEGELTIHTLLVNVKVSESSKERVRCWDGY